MNIIHIILLLGLIFVAINRGSVYFDLRNKPENEQDVKECKKAKREFIWSVAVATVYACIKLM